MMMTPAFAAAKAVIKTMIMKLGAFLNVREAEKCLMAALAYVTAQITGSQTAQIANVQAVTIRKKTNALLMKTIPMLRKMEATVTRVMIIPARLKDKLWILMASAFVMVQNGYSTQMP